MKHYPLRRYVTKSLEYNEPRHGKTFLAYICENKAADEHLCFRYIDSTIPLLLKSEISSLQPSSMAVQPGLCRTVGNPKTDFLVTRLFVAGDHLSPS